MTDFREDLHPRSGNGQFSKKEGWPPEVEISAFIANSTLEGRDIVGFRGSPHSPSVQSLDEGEEFQLGYGRADDEETERILKWVEAEGVTATATYEGFGRYGDASGESSDRDTFNYDITLRTDDGREFNIEYHMGSALTTAPTIAEILQSTASDSYGFADYEKDEYLKTLRDGGKNAEVQRYKGLGEMNSEELWETTMDPNRRILKQVAIEDAQDADMVFDMLMGTDVPARKSFIQSHAKEATLDI